MGQMGGEGTGAIPPVKYEQDGGNFAVAGNFRQTAPSCAWLKYVLEAEARMSKVIEVGAKRAMVRSDLSPHTCRVSGPPEALGDAPRNLPSDSAILPGHPLPIGDFKAGMRDRITSS
jgi:hypothetical protein